MGAERDMVQACVLDSASGCYLWTEEVICTGNQQCDPVMGECRCFDECSHAGASTCEDDVIYRCTADDQGCLIGKPLEQEGVINYDAQGLHLCTGFTRAHYASTTEVYPDSPRTNPAACIRAQVAAVRGGVDYALAALENH